MRRHEQNYKIELKIPKIYGEHSRSPFADYSDPDAADSAFRVPADYSDPDAVNSAFRVPAEFFLGIPNVFLLQKQPLLGARW